jgi:Fe2+ or Zn2+ uptake regulation protein
MPRWYVAEELEPQKLNRMGKTQKAVLDTLIERRPMKEWEVVSKLQKNNPDRVMPVQLYATLNTLIERGLVRRVPGSYVRYELIC